MNLIKENQLMREKIHDYFVKITDKLDAPKGYFLEINRLGKEIQQLTEVMKFNDIKNSKTDIMAILIINYDVRIKAINLEFDVKNVPKELRLGRFEK